MTSSPAAAPTTSAYQRAFDRGFGGLRFEPAVEHEFQHFSSLANLARIRAGAWLAFLLFGAFVVIDVLTLPAAVYRWTAPIRLFAIMPGFLLVLAASYRDGWKSRMALPLTVASLATGLGTVGVIGAGLRHGFPLPYEGILLVAMFIYLLACLDWWRAVAVNVVTMMAFFAVEVAWQADPLARMYQIAFMVAANLLGAFGGYVLEHGARSVFLAQKLLDERARQDGLTGLSNRRALDEHLARAWRQALRTQTEIAVAMVDVDHFKQYNDRYGHAQGDTALQAVATAVGEHARRPLDIAARYGGEEFMLVWYEPAGPDLLAMGEQVCAAVQALALEHAGTESGVLTASVGIAAVRPRADTSLRELLEAADAALYAAKDAGRNRARTWRLPEA